MNEETKPDKPFDAAAMLEELDGGVFMQKVARAVQDGALGATEHGRQATVTVTLTIDRIDESNQVSMKHKIKSVTPHKRGKVTDEDETATPLYVGQRGKLTVFPDNQEAFSFMRPRGNKADQQ